MGELSTNRFATRRPSDTPSQYARMILGTSSKPRLKVLETTVGGRKTVATKTTFATRLSNIARGIAARGVVEELLPHPIGNRAELSLLLAEDFLIISAAWLLTLTRGMSWFEMPIFASLVTLLSYSEGLYKSNGDPYSRGATLVLVRSTFFAGGLLWVSNWHGIHPISAIVISVNSLFGLVLFRQCKSWAWKRNQRKSGLRKVLIVGGGPVGCAIARALCSDSVQQNIFCGFLDDELPLSPTVLGRIGDLDWVARAEFVDEVILTLPGRSSLTRQVAETALRNHLDIRAVPDLPAGPWLDADIDRIGGMPIVTLHREQSAGGAVLCKRLLDIGGSAIALVLAGPLMALVAAMIRLDSPGPVVYSAKRTGAKGQSFRCHKFRSMVADADVLKENLQGLNQREGPIFKIENDPRITRIGRILRRYSLDELPQFWNVLRGEMSMVGPRPHPVEEVNHYELHHYRRLDVQPGITGLWQIKARKSPSFDLNMHLDLTYIENWSLGLDLRILAATVRVLFSPEGG